ncbi:hypothetical protein LBMAG56_06120 [Verrucomicrobiota bacterium]|nr:hypothetical protein LBMAG56_06120 [Verrucomicrobiota bacterium]
MKHLLAPLFCALLLATAAESFALIFELDRPGLAFPKDFPTATRTNLMAVLQRTDCTFLGGNGFNSDTHLKYGGDTQALNRFLDALTKCPGLTLSIRFYRYDETEKLDWAVDHSAWREPNSLCVRVNLNSKRIKLDDLAVPGTKGPRLAEDAK